MTQALDYAGLIQQAERTEERSLYRADAERSLLICLLRKPELIIDCIKAIKPDMLTQDAHRKLYEIMVYVYEVFVVRQGAPLSFDKMTLCMIADKLGPAYSKKFRETNEGYKLLEGLERSAYAFSPGEFDKYVTLVRESYAAIQSYRTSNQWRKQLLSKTSTPSDIAKIYERKAAAFAAYDVSGEGGPTTMREVATQFHAIHDMSYANGGINPYVVPLPGFNGLNEYLGGGVHRGNILTICARPKTGKTSLLVSIALELCKAGVHVAYCDNELTQDEMYTRVLSYVSGIKEYDILNHRYRSMGPEVYNTYVNAQHQVYRILEHFHYYSTKQDSPDMVAAKMKKYADEFVGYDVVYHNGKEYRLTRPGMVMYDWLKLDSESVGKNWAEHQAMGELISMFSRSIRTLNLPMICGAQTRQQVAKAVGSKGQEYSGGSNAAMSDRINWFSSTICELMPLSEEDCEAVANTFPRRHWSDPYDQKIEGLDLAFNQLIQIHMNRKGGVNRYGIPMWHFWGRYRYYDMFSPDTFAFLKDRANERRQKKTKVKGTSQLLSAAAQSTPLMAQSVPQTQVSPNVS